MFDFVIHNSSLVIAYELVAKGDGGKRERLEEELERLTARRVLASVWRYDGKMHEDAMKDHLLGFLEPRADRLFIINHLGAVANHNTLDEPPITQLE